MDLVNPVVSFMGVEDGDPIGHKRFLALFAGGMLPLISLSFLHMLVKFEEEEKKKIKQEVFDLDIDEISLRAGRMEAKSDEEKINPSQEELKKLEEELNRINEVKFEKPQTTSYTPVEEPKQTKTKKILSYLRRNSDA